MAGINDTGNQKQFGKRIYRWCHCHGEQLIAGFIDTGDKHSIANISTNFLKKLKRLGGPGDTDSRKNPAVENLCQTPFKQWRKGIKFDLPSAVLTPHYLSNHTTFTCATAPSP
jgi:hypothetical protein